MIDQIQGVLLMFQRDEIGDVVLLRMCHGKANALDLEFLQEISRTFEELAASDVGAVVLSGTGGIFSAGVDLKRLAAGGVEYTRDFIPALTDAFTKMFFFPRPLVAACNGHAIAGWRRGSQEGPNRCAGAVGWRTVSADRIADHQERSSPRSLARGGLCQSELRR